MKFKKLTSILLIASLAVSAVTACDSTDDNIGGGGSDAVVISLPSDETEETEETVPSQETEALDVIMYAVRKGVIKDDATISGNALATFEVGDSFHVVGIAGNSYVVEMPDGSLGYIIAYKLSIDAPIDPDTLVVVIDGEETEETETTAEAAESETDGTQAPASDEAPSDAPSEAEAPAPASSGPDMSVTYNGNSVSSYEVDGYGTVYGYFVDTSTFRSLVNAHRSEIGISEWNFSDADGARTRAIECTVSFSHDRPNGQSGLSVLGGYGGEIIYSATDSNGAYNGFMGSDGHRAIIENPDFANASSAAFVRVEWADGSWVYSASSLVCNCWQ